MIFVIPMRHTFQSYSHRFVDIDNTSKFGLVFPNITAGFPAAMYWCFTRHCCWHRDFPLSTSVFHDVFKSSFGSTKKIPRNFLALSSFGFSIAHFYFCFAFRCIRHMLPHVRPYILVLRLFSSWLSDPDHVCPSGEVCPCIWQFSFFHEYFLQQCIQWRMCCSGNVDELQRNGKWFFSRHVRFDSGFHMMTITEISCDRPEIIFSFRIMSCWVIWRGVGE